MLNSIRTIITQDAEVDDLNSLRHILLYANDIEIQKDIKARIDKNRYKIKTLLYRTSL